MTERGGSGHLPVNTARYIRAASDDQSNRTQSIVSPWTIRAVPIFSEWPSHCGQTDVMSESCLQSAILAVGVKNGVVSSLVRTTHKLAMTNNRKPRGTCSARGQ